MVDVDAAAGCMVMDVIAAQSSWLEENGEIKLLTQQDIAVLSDDTRL